MPGLVYKLEVLQSASIDSVAIGDLNQRFFGSLVLTFLVEPPRRLREEVKYQEKHHYILESGEKLPVDRVMRQILEVECSIDHRHAVDSTQQARYEGTGVCRNELHDV